MSQPVSRMSFGAFMGPFHPVGENPTLALERDLELVSRVTYPVPRWNKGERYMFHVDTVEIFTFVPAVE